MITRRHLFVTVLALLGSAPHAHAIWGIGDIVNDPLNLVQNTATAYRMLEQNANQVIQINNELRHLVALPESMIGDMMGTMQQYTRLLGEGMENVYRIQGTVQQFERLYQAGFGGNGDMLQRAQRLLGAVRQASQTAAQAQAIYERLTQQQASLRRLAAASQAAPGSLAAQQASNQLLGVLAEQQASTQQLLATQGRLQMTWIMRQVSAEEQAQWNAQQYLQMTPVPDWQSKAKPGPELPR